MLRKYLQITSKLDEVDSIPATRSVGLVFTIAILLIFISGIHPTRWLLAACAVLGIATTLILRFSHRG